MNRPARLEELRVALGEHADEARAVAMARYMKDRFVFFGVPSPARRAGQRAALGGWRPSQEELVEFARACWAEPERELQYAACDLLIRWARQSDASLIGELEWLVTHKSWWDTVDAIVHAVGDLVAAHPPLVATMDAWIDADDFWLARVAILHQLRYKQATDTARLFDYCLRRAGDREFFIRKAIGWALREYAKTDRAAVVAFVATHETALSGLSRREALRTRR